MKWSVRFRESDLKPYVRAVWWPKNYQTSRGWVKFHPFRRPGAFIAGWKRNPLAGIRKRQCRERLKARHDQYHFAFWKGFHGHWGYSPKRFLIPLP